MRAPTLTLLVLFTVAASAVAEGEDWALFAGTTGNFQVLLPAPPVITHDRHSTYLGDVIGTRLDTRMGPHRVTVTHQDIPSIATALMPDSVILDEAGDSVVEANDGTIRQDRSYDWQGFAAREITYAMPGESPRLARVRLFLVESRIYMVIASWPAPRDIPPRLVDFLDSFALTEPADTPAVGDGRE